ncbi:hypothetical protein QMK33_18950 [Hymenobacter sp. H14-R3]|uniref:hypothetical protein n=1 Tax=Hymenobacter sp. H14-R3 TaxID=3046308 RepID=UPI0024B9C061|nr:hypothetical protein [Hymenobacter sp. H14-R3]MDJ0367232.1 hypothetical protein [Hymenobacter sp. H14-R3]
MPTTVLPASALDAEIISHLDGWVELLEQQKFAEAMRIIPSQRATWWNADLLAEVIASYGDGPDNRVTLVNNGTALDGAGKLHPARQRKEVSWHGQRGSVWYDLNINGLVSDLTATFNMVKTAMQLTIKLDDVHIM